MCIEPLAKCLGAVSAQEVGATAIKERQSPTGLVGKGVVVNCPPPTIAFNPHTLQNRSGV